MRALTSASLIVTPVLIAVLSGCYPRSYDYVLTQEFSGVLVKAGAPMPGATVSVSHTRGDTGDYCVDPEPVAVTDERGAFHVPPKIQRHHFTSILNPPQRMSQSMSICFQALGKRKLGALVVSPVSRQISYSAVCDWDSRGVAFPQPTVLPPYEWGICTRSDQSPGH